MTAALDPQTAAQIVDRAAPGAASVEDGRLILDGAQLIDAVRALRDDPDADLIFLSSLTAVDHEEHFEVVYHLQSLDQNHLLTARARIDDREDPAVPSLTALYHGAHLQECEVFDLFGIRFDGHPDLRRLFLWDGFPGYPLRKDFLQMPGQVRAGLPGFPHESADNAWPVPGSVPTRPMHPNDPPVPSDLIVAAEDGEGDA